MLAKTAADRQPDSRLPIPVRFILDDFSTNMVIPEFDKIISVIRSREIYVSLIVQSLSQLEDLYGHAKAQTIINNCDHCLYLGGTDTQTARYFAEKFNCQVSTVLNLPLDSAFLFTRGSQPRRVQKYELNRDDFYSSLNRPRDGPEDVPDPGAEDTAAGAVRDQLFLSQWDYSPASLEAKSEDAPTPEFQALLVEQIDPQRLKNAMAEINTAVTNLFMLWAEPYLWMEERPK